MIYTHVAATLLAALVASVGTWRVQEWRHAAIDAERAEAQHEVERQIARGVAGAATAHEEARENIVTEFKTITVQVDHEIEKPVYRDRCIDAGGLRIISQAIGGQHAGDPGESGAEVPAADTAN